MTTANIIFMVLMAGVMTMVYLVIYKDKFHGIIQIIKKIYKIFNFQLKISEAEFNLNNKSEIIARYFENPATLKSFEDNVTKKLYSKVNPKIPTRDINYFFAGLFEQHIGLYKGLARLSAKLNSEKNIAKVYKYIDIQTTHLPQIIDFEGGDILNSEIFEVIQRVLVSDSKIGIWQLIEELLKDLEKNDIAPQKITEQLLKIKGSLLSINENNIAFTQYYSDLIHRYTSKHLDATSKSNNIEKYYTAESIEKLFIEPMNRKIFTKNFQRFGILDNNGNLTEKFQYSDFGTVKTKVFPKNAYVLIFEKLIEEGFMMPFPVQDNTIKAKLIRNFLNIKEPYNGNNISKSSIDSQKFDQVKEALKKFSIEL